MLMVVHLILIVLTSLIQLRGLIVLKIRLPTLLTVDTPQALTSVTTLMGVSNVITKVSIMVQ
ncbi:MAG: hypothetical protein BWK73_49905 [Thiothrix lacustris]|uniref:Uncharacterized protein n=1 Tax=Thiothrix lacustris TaxID=525917 RepID=A0A1Y1Q8L7_9GAMM|nr:MAG: hypothetical protein BWK73_49905 [Thiothrix lacustris]